MAIGSFRGQLESTISKRMGATDDPYKARRTSAQADYQAQASKAREDLSERLNRLGVLRGAGATASQFGEFESGVLRGQQAIGAQFEAQREAGIGQALQQGIGLYGTTEQAGLAGRQQTEAERTGALQRDISTRDLLMRENIAGRQQTEAERSALAQEGLQAGALTGTYGRQRTLGQQQQDLAYRVGIGGLTGTDIAGGGAQTEAARAQQEREAIARAEITGRYGADEQATLARQELIGQVGGEESLAAQELALRRGQALGEIEGADTLAAELGRGALTEQTAAREQLATQASMERGLRRTEGLYGRQSTERQAQLERQARADLQTAQFEEAQLGREFAGEEAGFARDLAREELMGYAEVDGRREQTLAAREAGAQRRLTEAESRRGRTFEAEQAGLGRTFQQTEATRGREFQMQMRAAELEAEGVQAEEARALAREEMYGQDVSGLSPMQIQALGGTLGARGQAADISAEGRRLAEMEAAGTTQRDVATRGMAEVEAAGLSQREIAGESARMREAELMGYTEDERGRRQQTLGAREAGAGRRLAERGLAETERAGLEQERLEGLRIAEMGASGAAQRELSRAELYGTGDVMLQGGETAAVREAREGRRLITGESALERGSREEQANLERIQRGTLASEQRGLAREELYGRAMTEAEARGGGYAGDTLATQGLAQEAEQAELQRGLAREEMFGYREVDGGRERTLGAAEAGRERALRQQELTQRETLQAADIAARQRESQEGRLLAREELYGTGDVSAQRGSTLASQEIAQRGRLAGEEITSREGMAAEQRRLGREELYGTATRRQGEESIAARQARGELDLRGEDLALRRELGERGLGQESRRLSLAEAELYGVSQAGQTTLAASEAAAERASRERLAGEDIALRGELGRGQLEEARTAGAAGRRLAEADVYGYGQGGQTLAAREAAAQRGLEGRRLTEMERAGGAATEAERQRFRLASEELYGGAGVDTRMGTLAKREADRAGGFERERIDLAGEAGQREADRNRLMEEELYGGVGRRELGGTTLSQQEAYRAARESTRDYDLRADDYALRAELGRGELAEREAAGQAGRFQEGRRTDLAQAEVYGTGRGGQTFAAKEAASARGERALDRALDTRRTDLAEEELYGYREDPRGRREETVGARASRRGLELTEAGVTGQYGGQDTMAQRLATIEQTQRNRQINLQQEDLYGGRYDSQGQLVRGTLSSEERADRQAARQFDEEERMLDTRLRAIALRQTRPEGYEALPEEDRLLNEMLGGEPPLPFRARGGTFARMGQQLRAAQEGVDVDDLYRNPSARPQRTYRSDPRVKENVLHIGNSPSGLNIYEFDYKVGLGPVGRYRGVMANEIPQSATVSQSGQYDMVDYSMIDVEFERIN